MIHNISQAGTGTMSFSLPTPLWFDWKGRSLSVGSPVGDQPVMLEKGKEVTLLRYEAREAIPDQGKESPKQEPHVIRLTFSVRVGASPDQPRSD